jgi:hypothetical protein
MTIHEAMSLIDRRVAAGAHLTIKNEAPMPRFGIPETVTVRLRGVRHDGLSYSPQVTAWEYDSAVIGVGHFLARLEAAA